MTTPPALPVVTSHLPDIHPASWSGWATDDTSNGELFRGEVYLRHGYGSPEELYIDASWTNAIDLSGAGFSVDFTYRVTLPFQKLLMIIHGSGGGADIIQLLMDANSITLYNGNDVFHFTSWVPIGLAHVVVHFGEFLTFVDINDVTYIRTTGLATFTNFSAQIIGIDWGGLIQDTRFDEVSLYRDIREAPQSPAPSPRIAFYSDIYSNAGTLDAATAGTGTWTEGADIYLGVVGYSGGTVSWELDWIPTFGEPSPYVVSQSGASVRIKLPDIGGGATSRGDLSITASIDGLHSNVALLTSTGSGLAWGPAS